MPYNRDEVIASVTEFYVFLTTHLHFYPSELKTPPPAGWPQITSSRFAVQRKSETVIDLLRHLPYLPGGNDADRFIHDLTVCADYTIESVGLDNELSIPEIAEHCPWDKLKDLSRREHIVTLGFPKTDAGHFFYLDTLDGEVAMWGLEDTSCSSFNSAAEFYSWLRKQYEELKIFPMPDEVVPLTKERHQSFKEIIRSLGWPPGEASTWKREEGMKEVERIGPSYHYGTNSEGVTL